MLEWIRKRRPCFLRRHLWQHTRFWDLAALTDPAFPTAILLYGMMCTRPGCGAHEPMGTLIQESLTSWEHSEYLKSGEVPRSVIARWQASNLSRVGSIRS